MGKKNRKTKSKRASEATIDRVAEWLEGHVQGIACILEDALHDKDLGRREAASYLMWALRDTAKSAAGALRGGPGDFNQMSNLLEVPPEELVRILRIPAPDADEDPEPRFRDDLAMLLQAKIPARAKATEACA